MPRLACRPRACMHALLPTSQRRRTGLAGSACPIECGAHAMPAVPAARTDEVAMRGAIEVAGTTSTLVSAFLSKVGGARCLGVAAHAAATACRNPTPKPLFGLSKHAFTPFLPLSCKQAPAMPVVRRHSRGDGQFHFAPAVQVGWACSGGGPAARAVVVAAAGFDSVHGSLGKAGPTTGPPLSVAGEQLCSCFIPNAAQVVSGNYVTAKRRGVVNGIDFGALPARACCLRFSTWGSHSRHAGTPRPCYMPLAPHPPN